MIMLNLWVWWQTDKQKQAQQLNATLFVYWSIPTSLLHLGMTRAVFLFCILYRASMLCMKLKSVIFHFRTKLSKWLSFAFKNCHLKSKVVHQVHTICKKRGQLNWFAFCISIYWKVNNKYKVHSRAICTKKLTWWFQLFNCGMAENGGLKRSCVFCIGLLPTD